MMVSKEGQNHPQNDLFQGAEQNWAVQKYVYIM